MNCHLAKGKLIRVFTSKAGMKTDFVEAMVFVRVIIPLISGFRRDVDVVCGFWVITRRRVVINYRRFITKLHIHPEGVPKSLAGILCTVAPNICGSSVWNLFQVNLPAPRILRCLLDFSKVS
jgi:hypothetical protein